jgi:branched-subunit amino acid ABC-type transport system permease component
VQILSSLLIGLGAGAVFAAIGLGVVLVYRGSGVVNFGQGALAIWPAYVFAQLRANGRYVPPVPWVPMIELSRGPLSYWPSLVVALATSALLGWVAHALIFRPLRRRPVLAKVVASVGIMLYFQALVVLRFGPDPIGAPQALPSGVVHLIGVTIPTNRLYLTGLTILVAAGLWAVYRFTRFGLATRAAAENEKGASVLGFSPDRLASTNWILGAVIAGLGGILVAPITTLSPALASLLVVPALAAALVGRLTSFGLTAAAAIVMGMIESEITYIQSSVSWFPKEAVQEAVPFLVIVVVLFLSGDKLPVRGALEQGRLPRSMVSFHVGRSAAIATAIGLVCLFTFPSQLRYGLIASMVMAIVCLSFVVLTGYVGQISLAQMEFAGIAGFMVCHFGGDGIPFPLAPLLAALAATVVGVIVGIPALRIRGVMLAIVTLATAVALDDWLFTSPLFAGGFAGVSVTPPNLFGLHLSIDANVNNYPNALFGVFVLLVLAGSCVMVARMRRSVLGRRMLAVRTNERAAAAAGISVTSTKLAAYGISSFIAGLGGAMLAYQQIDPAGSSFTALTSVGVLAIAYLGGIASVPGAVLAGTISAGGLVFVAAQLWVHLPPAYQPILAAAGLISAAVANPEGIWVVAVQQLSALGRKLSFSNRLKPPSLRSSPDSDGRANVLRKAGVIASGQGHMVAGIEETGKTT